MNALAIFVGGQIDPQVYGFTANRAGYFWEDPATHKHLLEESGVE